jgi:polar amino acid transport system substrate-binding protein
MKPLIQLGLIPTIFLLVQSAFGETISLRADSWCPFNCSPKASQAGYMIDIAREVFKKKGIGIDYQIENWDTAKKRAAAGKIQGVVGASKGDGDFYFPATALGKYQNYLFFLPDKKQTRAKKFDTLRDLEGHKIGIVKDYAYGTEADRFIAKRPELFVKISGDEPLLTLIEMLEAGKISAFYECPQVFLYKLKMLNKNYAHFRRGLSFDSIEDDLFIAFSNKDPNAKKYAEILDQGIAEMRKSGRLLRVLDNYALSDWD